MTALEALKKRLIHDRLEVQREDGYVETELFTFQTPATKDDLVRLPNLSPSEMIDFLTLHNGAQLFVHPTYGGGIQLFSVDEIIEYRDVWECPDRFIPIGTGMDGEWIVCEIVNEHENYIWVGEFLTYEDDMEKLPIDYMRWLDYLIVAQGAHFWDWFRR